MNHARRALLLFVCCLVGCCFPKAWAASAAQAAAAPNLGQTYLSLSEYVGGYSRYFGHELRGPGVKLDWAFTRNGFLMASYRRLEVLGTGTLEHRAALGVGYATDPTGAASAYLSMEFVRSTLHPPGSARVDDYWKMSYGIRQNIERYLELDFGLYGEVNQHFGPRRLGAFLGFGVNAGPFQLDADYDHNSDVNALEFRLRCFF
jgi:hypothetical protein